MRNSSDSFYGEAIEYSDLDKTQYPLLARVLVLFSSQKVELLKKWKNIYDRIVDCRVDLSYTQPVRLDKCAP
jgi:hypothetical protein